MMTEEVKALLQDYFSAMSNLYGIIPLWKVLEIYNSQNEPITEDELKELVETFDCENKFYDFIGEDEIYELDEPTPIMDYYLAGDYILEDFDEFIEMRDFHTIFDYYVPKKEKLLRYKDDFFFEKSLEFIDLRAFLRNLPYLSKEMADGIAEDVYFNLHMMKPGNKDYSFVFDWAIHQGFNDKEEKNMKELTKLAFILNRHVRKHWLCGHTADEVNF